MSLLTHLRPSEGCTLTGAHSVEDSCYVLSLVVENNSDLLSNVARSAEWKLNSFLKRSFCDDHLSDQGIFVGHSEDKSEKIKICFSQPDGVEINGNL